MGLQGQISVPNIGGRVLIAAATGTTSAPTTAANGFMYEAKGFKVYTYLVNEGPVGTITFYGTLDPAAAANPTGSQAVSWSILGTLAITATSTNVFTFTGPLVATAAAVTAFTSGTITCWVQAVP